MYARHNPIIAKAMRSDADNFARGCYFAIGSIRQKIFNVPVMVDSYEIEGPASEYAWGHKRDAVAFVSTHARSLQAGLLTLDGSNRADCAIGLAALQAIPGIGLVKGAFILQLMGFDIGCYDSRNIARLGLNANKLRPAKHLSEQARMKRLHRYVDLAHGKSAQLWDEWCVDVGNAYGFKPREISAMHLCIAKKRQYDLAETF